MDNILPIILIVLVLILIFIAYQFNEVNKVNKQFLKKINSLEKEVLELSIEKTQLAKENTILEAVKLKYQLQPHTVNNFFAQMRSFASRLHKGMESLSTTLEYVFYKGSDNFVSIEEELEFIKNYVELNKSFLPEYSSVKIDSSLIDENLNPENKRIPHLITAYFLENAFKHGDKTHPEFLRIFVKANNTFFEIKVVNKLRLNVSKVLKKGIGLENMKRRLDIFTPNRYTLKTSCNETEYHSTLVITF
jgi:LytS/YehU family sensor histidine kinase